MTTGARPWPGLASVSGQRDPSPQAVVPASRQCMGAVRSLRPRQHHTTRRSASLSLSAPMAEATGMGAGARVCLCHALAGPIGSMNNQPQQLMRRAADAEARRAGNDSPA
jgi:hypothetical protein